MDLKLVASRFESLGGGAFVQHRSYGCEFGMFQRSAGHVSISFLSWCVIQAEPLLRGLKNRFEGVEDITRLKMRRAGPSNWHALQETYGISTAHTGLSYANYSEEQATQKHLKSLVFTRDKFLDDLTTSEKIFVYRTRDGALPDDEVQDIAEAVHSYGGRPLLYVKADPVRPFKVTRVNDALLIGTIDKFTELNDHTRHNHYGWERVCRAAVNVVGG